MSPQTVEEEDAKAQRGSAEGRGHGLAWLGGCPPPVCLGHGLQQGPREEAAEMLGWGLRRSGEEAGNDWMWECATSTCGRCGGPLLMAPQLRALALPGAPAASRPAQGLWLPGGAARRLPAAEDGALVSRL